jgi:hypothetical protein
MSILKHTGSSLLLIAALAAAGCGGGGGGGDPYAMPTPTPTPTPSPTPTAESYTNWFKVAVFSQPAANPPVDMDTLVINFDSNENPDAFSDLFPPEV